MATSIQATGRCLFLAGGSSSTSTGLTYYDDLQFARMGNDGHLSPWTTSPNQLKIPRSNHSLVFVTTDKGNYLNAVAGVAQIGEDTVHLDSVEVAKVGDDCSVGEWTLADYHLKGGRSTPQDIVVRNNVVVLGGWGDLDLIDEYSDVQTSIVRSNGSPSPWRTSSSRLTTGLYGHADVFAEPEKQEGQSLLMTVGGQPGTGAYASWIGYAYVMPGPLPDAIGICRIAPTGRLTAGRAGAIPISFDSPISNLPPGMMASLTGSGMRRLHPINDFGGRGTGPQEPLPTPKPSPHPTPPSAAQQNQFNDCLAPALNLYRGRLPGIAGKTIAGGAGLGVGIAVFKGGPSVGFGVRAAARTFGGPLTRSSLFHGLMEIKHAAWISTPIHLLSGQALAKGLEQLIDNRKAFEAAIADCAKKWPLANAPSF